MLSQMIQDVFFAGRAYHARAKENNGTVSYYPVEGVPSLEDIELHLKGEITLGSYTLLPDSKVSYLCLDVDCTDRVRARNIAGELSDKLGDTPHAVEFSGNKGYHVLVFLAETVPAPEVKAFGVRLRESVGAPASGNPHVEIFPKQDSLTPSAPMGNLLKVPLGLHPKTHHRSTFVDLHNGWEEGDPIDPGLMLSRRVVFADMVNALEEASPKQKMITSLLPYWVDGERHNLALSLSGFLASLGWRKDEVSDMMDSLILQGGGDHSNLHECVDNTFTKLAEGKQVQGFSGLNERLPVAVMRQLAELAGQNIAEPVLQILDRIRLDKGASFLKVRSTEHTVMSHLRESGKFISADNTVYWLDYVKHTLINCEGTGWLSMFRQRFGINGKEAFGQQVLHGVYLSAYANNEIAKVHKRFYWDGGRLWLNFGGAEVYALNGDPGERVMGYNGENNLFFHTDGNEMASEVGAVNLLDREPLDPWQFITNDLSFEKGETATISNEQQHQLLRAWVLQLFFGEILPTRPLALFLGPRGSGKTTSARRILRFFEGFHQDVLSITSDKEDAMRTSIQDHLVLVLDNLEQTKVRWLDNMLNKLATGAQIELRKLHKTNERFVIKPDCFVMMTGIGFPSSEEALYSRVLPFEMKSLAHPQPEYYMQSLLKDNLIGAWRGMVDVLDSVILELVNHPTVPSPTDSRLADFSVFCQKIKYCNSLNGEMLTEGLRKLTGSQNNAMARNSPAVAALEAWLEVSGKQRLELGDDKDAGVWRTTSELFHVLAKVASINKIDDFKWSSPQGFSRHWNLLVDGLKVTNGLQVEMFPDKVNGGLLPKYRFQPIMVK